MRRGSRRGTDRERKVREQLEAEGWVVARAAGSRGCADLMAVRRVGTRLLVHSEPAHEPVVQVRLVQVKSDERNPFDHFGPYERAELLATAQQAGAEPWLVWWPPDRKGPRWIAPGEWPQVRAAA